MYHSQRGQKRELKTVLWFPPCVPSAGGQLSSLAPSERSAVISPPPRGCFLRFPPALPGLPCIPPPCWSHIMLASDVPAGQQVCAQLCTCRTIASLHLVPHARAARAHAAVMAGTPLSSSCTRLVALLMTTLTAAGSRP